MADRGARGWFGPGNVFGSSSLGYGVGNVAFLKSEESKVYKYFRLIEFGTDIFIGRRLYGLWGSGTRGVVRGDLTAMGAGAGQQFFPIGWTQHRVLSSKTSALEYLRDTDQKPHIHGIIRKGIQPMEAYETAFASFGPGEREVAAIEQAFEHAGVGRKQGKGRRTATKAQTKRFATVNLRGRFLAAQALSANSLSLARLDATFRSELTAANRLLAEALAGEVALVIREKLKRPATSSGKLEEATLDPRNRFPS